MTALNSLEKITKLDLDFRMKIFRDRLLISIFLGAVLGIFCIIGVGVRLGFSGNAWYLLGMWYNRVVMGVLIGFAGAWKIVRGMKNKFRNAAIRGFVLGGLVTSAIFLSTGLRDPLSWLAGFAYCVIIDVLATRFSSE